MRTPREVIEVYNYELWNKQRLHLADELLGDTLIRHEVGAVKTLTKAEATQRVTDTWSLVDNLEFVLLQLVADDELVSIVYECRVSRDGKQSVTSSIEVFRVVDGRICEVWNVPYVPGGWQ